jgi:hypothetical protein
MEGYTPGVYMPISETLLDIDTAPPQAPLETLSQAYEVLKNLREISIPPDEIHEVGKGKDIRDLNAMEFCSEFKMHKKKFLLAKEHFIRAHEHQDTVFAIISTLTSIFKTLPLSCDESVAMEQLLTDCQARMIERLNLPSLQTQLNEADKYYKTMVPLLREMQEELGEDMKPNTCPICFTNEITHAIVPCGHTICGSCKNKLRLSCFTCRCHVDTTVKLFL